MIISLAPHSLARRVRLGGCGYYPGNGRLSPAEPGAQRSLFCLALHGVFRAPPITRRAVGSYPAFSTLPDPLSATRRYILCDTLRPVRLSPSGPAHSTRHAAWECSDFPLHGMNPAQRSSDRPAAWKIAELGRMTRGKLNTPILFLFLSLLI